MRRRPPPKKARSIHSITSSVLAVLPASGESGRCRRRISDGHGIFAPGQSVAGLGYARPIASDGFDATLKTFRVVPWTDVSRRGKDSAQLSGS
jgi:hypothetical protein